MFVVTVDFRIRPAHVSDFMEAMRVQAETSLREEPGCRQFDICAPVGGAAPDRVFLYEVYDDRAAFDAHLASAHFRAFDRQVAPWVAEKSVAIHERLWP